MIAPPHPSPPQPTVVCSIRNSNENKRNSAGDDDDGNKEGGDDDGNKEGDGVDIQTCSTFPSGIWSKTQLNSVRSK